MTCFWDGILHSLTRDDFARHNVPRPPNFLHLIQFFKKRNVATPVIHWNGKTLTQQEQEENVRHIAEYDEATARRGYDCSTCEPFLFLVSHLFQVNIKHRYCKHLMTYDIEGASRTLTFTSNRGHFSAD